MDFNKLEYRWNDRLRPFNLHLRARVLTSRNTIIGNIPLPQNNLSILRILTNGCMITSSIDFADDMKIGLTFNYLVSKRSLERFDNICIDIAKDGFNFDLVKHNTSISKFYKFDKIHLRKFLYEETDVIISNKEFIQRNYIFNNVPILEVIFLVSVFDEAVEIISKYFGYDEEGNEINNIKYPVGSIVSLKDNDDDDYIISSIKYNELIRYGIMKILSTRDSEVIMISDIINYYNEDDIKPNRGYRIDQILN